MSSLADSSPSPVAAARVALVALVVLAEFAIIAILLSATQLRCDLTGHETVCGFLSTSVMRGAGVVALGALYLFARAGRVAGNAASRRGSPWPWPAAQLAGFLVLLAPLLIAGDDVERVLRIGPPAWVLGSTLAAVGALLWIMPPAAWWSLVRRDPLTLAAVVLGGLAAPALVADDDMAWAWSPLARVTFAGVGTLAQLFGTAETDPSQYLIILDGFAVEIAAACSGLEGFALVTGLIAIYFWIDRGSLDFRRAWILLPVGLLLSFALNVVRITLLLVIGARISPQLAQDGFHGHAGWLMFVLLGLPLVGIARTVPWFRIAPAAGPRRPGPPSLARDPNAALILPFMALMFASLLASTFALVPELWYPLKVLATLAVLALFAPVLSRFEWRPDALSIGAGLAVGAAWALTAPAASATDTELAEALAVLPAAWLAGWAVFRVAGSVLLVPLVEEAFFRGYVLARLDGPGWRRAAAILVSAALFALLHDRWLAAFLSGIVFSLVMLRRGRLGDAVAAHAAANLVLAARAVARGDWAGF